MKRTLARIYWLGIAVTMAVLLFTMGLIAALRIQNTKEILRDLLETSAAWTLQGTASLQQQAEDIAAASPPVRVTFVMAGGLVLADSAEDPFAMPLHDDRPEIMEAMERGHGECLRLFGTGEPLALYAARRIAPNLILRLSYPLRDVTNLAVGYGIALLVLFAVLLLLQRGLLRRFIEALIRQMEDVQRLLSGEGGHRKATFPELQGALDSIAYRAERLNADLAEVNRTLSLRSDFVANASHEIRSPLTSIMGFAEMLDEGLADTPEEQAMCVRAIRSECRRMLDVVEDILLLSRAEGKMNGPMAPIAVRPIADEVLGSLSPQAGRRGITLAVQGEMTLPAVEKSLWEILYNLTDNAIRYGREGGHVWIRLEADTIQVQDDGCGIAPQHLPHIFEQFYRVDETRDASVRGTGLGLSIVRALAESLGGTIIAVSEVGVGSTFTLRFPAQEGGEEG